MLNSPDGYAVYITLSTEGYATNLVFTISIWYQIICFRPCNFCITPSFHLVDLQETFHYSLLLFINVLYCCNRVEVYTLYILFNQLNLCVSYCITLISPFRCYYCSLGKPMFPCERVDARWGKLECEQRACDVLGSLPNFREEDRHWYWL